MFSEVYFVFKETFWSQSIRCKEYLHELYFLHRVFLKNILSMTKKILTGFFMLSVVTGWVRVGLWDCQPPSVCGVGVGQSFTNHCPSSCPLFFVGYFAHCPYLYLEVSRASVFQFGNFSWKLVNSIHPNNEISVCHPSQFPTLQCILCNFHNLVVCNHNLFFCFFREQQLTLTQPWPIRFEYQFVHWIEPKNYSIQN